VRNPYRLSCILLFFMLPVAAPAQKIVVAGVKAVADCAFAAHPLQADLRTTHFPADWTFVLACTPIVWEKLQRTADALETNTGFTNVQGRITVLNARIYLEMPPLSGTTHPTARLILRHEHGHILCGCNDEWKADRAAGIY
jgi:hypothetical protein